MESDPITTKEERWHRVRNLGHGAYGTVWQEQCVDEPQDSPRKVRAVKSTPKHHFVSWRRELNALMKFSQHHDHFVQIFGHHADDNSLFIYMEFVPHGTLQNYISKHPLQEYEAIKVTTQLAQALQYMHAAKFIHRDLKPQNVLVSSPAPNWHVKVADFGISKDIAETSAAVSAADRGTWAFMAPEIMNGGPTRGKRLRYTPAVDIWALGATTHCILTKEPPFGGNLSDISDYARERITFKADSKALRRCSHVCVQFLSDTMKVNKDLRLTIDQVLEHEWLREDPSESDTSSVASWDDGPTSPDAWQDTYYPEPTPHDSVLGSTQNTLKEPSRSASLGAGQLSIESAMLDPVKTVDEDAQSRVPSEAHHTSQALSRPLTSIQLMDKLTDKASLEAKDTISSPETPAALPPTTMRHEYLPFSVDADQNKEQEQIKHEGVQSSSTADPQEYDATPDAADKTPDSPIRDSVCLEVPSLVITGNRGDEEDKTPPIISIDTVADEPSIDTHPLLSRRSTPYAIVRPRSLFGDEDLNEPPLRPSEPVDETLAMGSGDDKGPESPTLSRSWIEDTQDLDPEPQRGPMAWFKRKLRRSKSNVNITTHQQDPRNGRFLCDNCFEDITDLHYHCSICQSGTFNLCTACFSSGYKCRNEDHKLVPQSRIARLSDDPVHDLAIDEHITKESLHQDDDFAGRQKAGTEAPQTTGDRTSDTESTSHDDRELVEPQIVVEHVSTDDHATEAITGQVEPDAEQPWCEEDVDVSQSADASPCGCLKPEEDCLLDQEASIQSEAKDDKELKATRPLQGGSMQSPSPGTVTDETLQFGSPKLMDFVDHPKEAKQHCRDPPPQLIGKFGLTIRRKPVNVRSQTLGGKTQLSSDTPDHMDQAQRTNSLPISASPRFHGRADSTISTSTLAKVDDNPPPTDSPSDSEVTGQADLAHERDVIDLGSGSPAEDPVDADQERVSMDEQGAEPEDHYREPYYELLRKRLRQAQDIARNRGDNTEDDEELYEAQTEDLEALIEEHKEELKARFHVVENLTSGSEEQRSHHLHELGELKRTLEEQVRELEEECVPDLHEPSAEKFAVLHTSHGDVVLAAQQLEGSRRRENDEVFSRFLTAVESMMFSFKQLWIVNFEGDVIRDDKLQNPQYLKLNCETGEGMVGGSIVEGEMQYAAVDIIEGLDALKSLRDLAPGWSWTMRGNFKLSGGVIMQAEVVESGKAPQKKTYAIRGDPGSVREEVVQRKVPKHVEEE